MLSFVTTGLDTDLRSVLVCVCVTSRITGSGDRMWHGRVLFGRALHLVDVGSLPANCWDEPVILLESAGFYQWGGFKAYFFPPSLQITLPLFRLKYQTLMGCRTSAKKSIISETAKIIAPIDQIGRRMVCPPAEVRKDKSWSFLKHVPFASIGSNHIKHLCSEKAGDQFRKTSQNEKIGLD